MEVGLDELIKWILTQYDDGPTQEQFMALCRRLFPGGKENEANEQD